MPAQSPKIEFDDVEVSTRVRQTVFLRLNSFARDGDMSGQPACRRDSMNGDFPRPVTFLLVVDLKLTCQYGTLRGRLFPLASLRVKKSVARVPTCCQLKFGARKMYVYSSWKHRRVSLLGGWRMTLSVYANLFGSHLCLLLILSGITAIYSPAHNMATSGGMTPAPLVNLLRIGKVCLKQAESGR